MPSRHRSLQFNDTTSNFAPFEVMDSEDDGASRFEQLLAARQGNHGRIVDRQSQVLRARGQLIQEEVAKEKYVLSHAKLQLDREKQLAEVTKQRVAMAQQIEQHKQSVKAITALADLDPHSKDFQLKVAHAFADNPMATRDPFAQTLTKDLFHIRQKKLDVDQEVRGYEEKKALEYSEKHGIDVPMKEGKRDFVGAEKALRQRTEEDRIHSEASVDPSLKISETTVGPDGKITSRYKSIADKTPADVVTTVTKDADTGASTTTRHVVPTTSAPAATAAPKDRKPLGDLIPIN